MFIDEWLNDKIVVYVVTSVVQCEVKRVPSEQLIVASAVPKSVEQS